MFAAGAGVRVGAGFPLSGRVVGQRVALRALSPGDRRELDHRLESRRHCGGKFLGADNKMDILLHSLE